MPPCPRSRSGSVRDLRDRALIAMLTYSFARIACMDSSTARHWLNTMVSKAASAVAWGLPVAAEGRKASRGQRLVHQRPCLNRSPGDVTICL